MSLDYMLSKEYFSSNATTILTYKGKKSTSLVLIKLFNKIDLANEI